MEILLIRTTRRMDRCMWQKDELGKPARQTTATTRKKLQSQPHGKAMEAYGKHMASIWEAQGCSRLSYNVNGRRLRRCSLGLRLNFREWIGGRRRKASLLISFGYTWLKAVSVYGKHSRARGA